MKSKRTGTILMTMGGVLLAAALLLTCYNFYEAQRASLASQELLPDIQKEIIQKKTEDAPAEHINPYEEDAYAMTEVTIDGYSYIGYLSIPALQIELPVMSAWDETRLKIAPCRQFGSTKSDDLVIAGHNYRRHFGKLSRLDIYDRIQFVDMDGELSTYQIGMIDIIPAKATDIVKNSDWDIVLYTCTFRGNKRVMVGASRISE